MYRQDSQPNVPLLSHLPTEKAAEFSGWHWDPARRKDVTPVAGQPSAPAVAPAPISEQSYNDSTNGTLDERAQRFLRAVANNPGRPSSAIARLAGLGTHQAIAVRKQLIELGYLREHRVSTSTRGRAAKILEPLPKARELLNG